MLWRAGQGVSHHQQPRGEEAVEPCTEQLLQNQASQYQKSVDPQDRDMPNMTDNDEENQITPAGTTLRKNLSALDHLSVSLMTGCEPPTKSLIRMNRLLLLPKSLKRTQVLSKLNLNPLKTSLLLLDWSWRMRRRRKFLSRKLQNLLPPNLQLPNTPRMLSHTTHMDFPYQVQLPPRADQEGVYQGTQQVPQVP